uniref:uncharacterized protein LOC122602361 n=1 Tax=Erigeron canadensis TaxID=72917 RepID=UPI001CB88C90|nr:uncharacterized protein LOC122602361 [Erigeron canadensis]
MANRKNPPPPSGRTNLASCIVATIFLLFITTLILIIFFTLFKPKPPTITISAVQLPSFSVTNSTAVTVTLTISHYITVTNSNHGVFTHYDSSLQLLNAGNQMWFMFVPSGKIGARRKVYMAATFDVEGFPVELKDNGLNGFRVGQSLEIETKMEMAGRVRVMHFFTHYVVVKVECKVAIGVNDGSVVGFHC